MKNYPATTARAKWSWPSWIHIQPLHVHPIWKVVLTMACLLLLGLPALQEQGISTDERDDVLAPYWNFRLLTTGEPIDNNVAYYGTVFPFLAEASFQAAYFLEHGTWGVRYFETGGSPYDYAGMQEFRQRIDLRHRLTFLISLAAYAAVAGLVAMLAGPQVAWIGPLLLALLPRFWGDSFFNPRDIPFAALFTTGTYFGARLLAGYFETDVALITPRNRRLMLQTLLYGVLVGVATGTRLAACFLLAFVLIAHLIVYGLRSRMHFRNFMRFWWVYALMGVAWMLTVYALHPASWSSPLTWLVDALSFLSRYQWSGSNLYNGTFVAGLETPWHYLPTWFAITTPLSVLMLALGGGSALLVRYRTLTHSQQAGVVLLLLQIGFLPLVAIARASTIYDGIRQFLFILPPVAVLATVGLVWIIQHCANAYVRAGAVACAIALGALIVVDMRSLHPYEYIYFNRAFGGLEAAQARFDTEYSGLSMREGMEWLNEHAAAGATVVSSRELHSSKTFAAQTLNVVSYRQYEEGGVARPFYYLARPRFSLQLRFPECPVVYQVMRQDVPLTIVKRCN